MPDAHVTEDYLDTFIDAYIECALWADLDPDGDNWGACYYVSDVNRASVERDCRDFVAANRTDLSSVDASAAGHDFWLTRNGHGAGYWDRGLGALGLRLAEAARIYGETSLYLDPTDGHLYQD